MRKIITCIIFTIISNILYSQDSISRKATYYHDKFEGRKTASGEIFDQNKLTAASNYYKIGTIVIVINEETGEWVEVKINDRMADKHTSKRIDLSKKAFRKISKIEKGIIKVKIIEL